MTLEKRVYGTPITTLASVLALLVPSHANAFWNGSRPPAHYSSQIEAISTKTAEDSAFAVIGKYIGTSSLTALGLSLQLNAQDERAYTLLAGSGPFLPLTKNLSIQPFVLGTYTFGTRQGTVQPHLYGTWTPGSDGKYVVDAFGSASFGYARDERTSVLKVPPLHFTGASAGIQGTMQVLETKDAQSVQNVRLGFALSTSYIDEKMIPTYEGVLGLFGEQYGRQFEVRAGCSYPADNCQVTAKLRVLF